MAVLDSLVQQAGRIASDLQVSLRKARLEGERRLLGRQHRAALESLGERVYELVRAGTLPEEPVSAQMAAVESSLMEIDAKAAEIAAMRVAGEGAGTGDDGSGAPDTDAVRAFPMLARDQDPPARAAGAGPGWDAAERFFRRS